MKTLKQKMQVISAKRRTKIEARSATLIERPHASRTNECFVFRCRWNGTVI
jgi:hypothetical protein